MWWQRLTLRLKRIFRSTDLLPSDNLKSGEYFQFDFDKYPVKFAKGTSLSCDNLTAVSLYVLIFGFSWLIINQY